MNEFRRGDRRPAKGPVIKETIVEVGVEIGLITTVEAKHNDNSVDLEDLEIQVKEKMSDLFDIDGRDKVLNNVCIYAIQ